MDETSFLDDTGKDPDFVPNYKEDSDDSVFDTNDSPVDENKIIDEMRPEENKEMRTEDSRDPSAFPVEGEPRESVSESGTPRKRKRPKTKREIRKERRNKGYNRVWQKDAKEKCWSEVQKFTLQGQRVLLS
ncbi:hypothetical protein PoB_002571600 [Plakobranchus ocellatus]|uniref:Uncharacterized protein n=1 Tax=Plakobranchus ocellatus TaxID=259542 RepID=A0AAV3ZTA4_9GAST|nr:hypothetical protein PoB_002571600 [Plakobranchus ocellatus]